MTLDAKFAAFLRQNPDAYKLIVKLARAEIAEGANRLSAKRLFEDARAKLKRRKRRMGVPSLDNSLTSRLARSLERRPEFRGRFELRRLADGRLH